MAALFPGIAAAGDQVEDQFEQRIQPILEDRCYGCHGNGEKKGNVTLDGFATDTARLRDPNFWWGVLKNVRADIMPPAGKPRPTDQEKKLLEDWIKYGVFRIDPKNPDPGRVTVRRLNRVEYRNTIRDLMGVDYDTTAEFPPDDTGHGFDNIGEVLTLSPMLLEKYVTSARAIVSAAVPTTSRVVAEKTVGGRRFHPPGTPAAADHDDGPLTLSYYQAATVSAAVQAEYPGRYQLVLDLTANERYVEGIFDLNHCRLIFKIDGREVLTREYTPAGRQGLPRCGRSGLATRRTPAHTRAQATDAGRKAGAVAQPPDQVGDPARSAGRTVLGPTLYLHALFPQGCAREPG